MSSFVYFIKPVGMDGPIKIGFSKKPADRLLRLYKTAAHLAVIGKSNERTAARWLSGEFDPPISVVLAMNHEIFGEAE